MKMDWSSTILIMLWNGIIAGLLSKSIEVGILFGGVNLFGGFLHALIFHTNTGN